MTCLARYLCSYRDAGRGEGPGGRHGPTVFDRSVNTIPSRGRGQIMPTKLLLPPLWTFRRLCSTCLLARLIRFLLIFSQIWYVLHVCSTCISTVRPSFVQFKCRYFPPNYIMCGLTVLQFDWTLRFYILRFTQSTHVTKVTRVDVRLRSQKNLGSDFSLLASGGLGAGPRRFIKGQDWSVLALIRPNG